MSVDPLDHHPHRGLGPTPPRRWLALTRLQSVLLILVSLVVIFGATWLDLVMMDQLVRDGWL